MATGIQHAFWFSFVDNDNFPKELYQSRVELKCIVCLDLDVYLVIDSCDATYVINTGFGKEQNWCEFSMELPIMKETVAELQMIHDIRLSLRQFQTRTGFTRSEIEGHIMHIIDRAPKPYLRHVKECARLGKRIPFQPSPFTSTTFPGHVEAYCVAPGAKVTGCNFEGATAIGISSTSTGGLRF